MSSGRRGPACWSGYEPLSDSAWINLLVTPFAAVYDLCTCPGQAALFGFGPYRSTREPARAQPYGAPAGALRSVRGESSSFSGFDSAQGPGKLANHMETGGPAEQPQAPHTPQSDRQLVEGVLAGKTAAEREFVERMRCVPRVLASLNKRLGHPLRQEEMEDLVQDVQLDVWKKLDAYEGRAALETWAFRFCQIGFLRALERRQRRSGVVAYCAIETIENLAPSQESQAAGSGSGDRPGEDLVALLRHLSEREAQVTRLRHLEQLEFAEIADLLDVSLSTAKTHYYRAVEKLREIMGDQPEQSQ